MRRQASRGEIQLGSTKVEQRRLVVRAKEWQRALEAVLKDVYSLLQVYASSPDGPAATLVFRAEDLIMAVSIESKMTGLTSGGTPCKVESGEAPWPGGCLLFRTSLTVEGSEPPLSTA